MLINCKYCNSKFAINAEEVGFDGRLVKCENCEKEWFQESKPKYLEKKLIELDRSLHATELHLIEQKNIHNDKIAKLEKSLKVKKDELAKQKLLEDRISLFEKRISEGSNILDLGCGTGTLLGKLSNYGFCGTGIDVAPEMVKEAKRKYPSLYL